MPEIHFINQSYIRGSKNSNEVNEQCLPNTEFKLMHEVDNEH